LYLQELKNDGKIIGNSYSFFTTSRGIQMYSNPPYKALMQSVEELENEARKTQKTHAELNPE